MSSSRKPSVAAGTSLASLGHGPVVLLTLMLVLAVVVVSVASLALHYRVDVREEGERLAESGRRTAILLDVLSRRAAARLDAGAAMDSAIAELQGIRTELRRSQDTHEVLVARRDGDSIVFLLADLTENGLVPPAVPWDGPLAEPMRRALSGLSGVMVGTDHRGRRVLASYQPATAARLGVVSKVDLAELRRPFMWIAGGVVVVAVLLTVPFLWLARRVSMRMTRALTAVEERVNRALASAGAFMWSWSPSDDTLTVGTSGDDVFGVAPGSHPSTRENALALLDPDEETRVREAMRESLETGHAFNAESRVRYPGMEPRWIHSTGVAVRDREGRAFRVDGVSWDVTARREAEERSASVTRMYAMLSRVNAAIVRQRDREGLMTEICRTIADVGGFRLAWVGTVAPESGTVHAVARAGPAASYLDGIEITARDEPLGRGPAGTCVRERRTVTLHHVLSDERMAPWREKARRNDLQSVCAVPLCQGDTTYGLLAVYSQDPEFFSGTQVTLLEETAANVAYALERLRVEEEHVELTEQLRQAQKMEIIGQLAGGMAHDFNNILTVILANNALIEADLPSDRPSLGAFATEVEVAARRGAEMVRKLLAFSRREQINRRPTDLCTVVQDLAKALKRLVPESVMIKVEASGPALTVSADAGAVEQILANLVTNARDAMPRGGNLNIRVGGLRLTDADSSSHGLAPGPYVCVDVEDTGVGMTPEVRNRIFEPFFTTKEAGKGTGLGMPMVFGLMKQHDGHVSIYSEPGLGTRVRLYFPADASSAPTAAAADSATPTTPPGGTETLLLVEDEPALLRVGRRILERLGYTVLAASDGVEALDVYHANADSIDLVISDLVMPRMDGNALRRAMQELEHPPKFMMASGYAPQELRESWPAGAVRIVEKPWTAPQLARVVREVLDA